MSKICCCCFIRSNQMMKPIRMQPPSSCILAMVCAASLHAETQIQWYSVLCTMQTMKTWILMIILQNVHWTVKVKCCWMSASACIQTEQWIKFTGKCSNGNQNVTKLANQWRTFLCHWNRTLSTEMHWCLLNKNERWKVKMRSWSMQNNMVIHLDGWHQTDAKWKRKRISWLKRSSERLNVYIVLHHNLIRLF